MDTSLQILPILDVAKHNELNIVTWNRNMAAQFKVFLGNQVMLIKKRIRSQIVWLYDSDSNHVFIEQKISVFPPYGQNPGHGCVQVTYC